MDLMSCRPAAFDAKIQAQPAAESDLLPREANSDESSDEEGMPALYQNNNRQVIYRPEVADSSDEEQ